MRKTVRKPEDGELRSEYDFSGGVRGKYARRYAQGTNVVVLEPDVAQAFPNAAAVNRSLPALAALVRQHQTRKGGIEGDPRGRPLRLRALAALR